MWPSAKEPAGWSRNFTAGTHQRVSVRMVDTSSEMSSENASSRDMKLRYSFSAVNLRTWLSSAAEGGIRSGD